MTWMPDAVLTPVEYNALGGREFQTARAQFFCPLSFCTTSPSWAIANSVAPRAGMRPIGAKEARRGCGRSSRHACRDPRMPWGEGTALAELALLDRAELADLGMARTRHDDAERPSPDSTWNLAPTVTFIRRINPSSLTRGDAP